MPSPSVEQAVSRVLLSGKAVLKTISANDVGATGSHQCGYYLPKQAWTSFTPHPPTKGSNADHEVTILWPDDIKTQSVVKWYGTGTRNEYRLTRFGRDFPFLREECVGNLLVLIPEQIDYFHAYVFESDTDMEDVLLALGLSMVNGWAAYDKGKVVEIENQCIKDRFERFAQLVSGFPTTSVMSEEARRTLVECAKGFVSEGPDQQLIRLVGVEYDLFKYVERRLSGSDINKPFDSIEDFLKVAQTILQRRKARAGASLENHTAFLLQNSGIPFDIRPCVDDTEPDILIPNKEAYYDIQYPREKLFVIGVKTTCKDRWRQVIQEAPKVPQKYILTLQHGISSKQMAEMKRSQVSLVVPTMLHKEYPSKTRPELFAVSDLFRMIKESVNIQ
jgi:type II restriction enzyme